MSLPTKRVITQAKKTEHREWLSEISAILLQQSLNDLNQAYQNFFKSTKGKRSGMMRTSLGTSRLVLTLPNRVI